MNACHIDYKLLDSKHTHTHWQSSALYHRPTDMTYQHFYAGCVLWVFTNDFNAEPRTGLYDTDVIRNLWSISELGSICGLDECLENIRLREVV